MLIETWWYLLEAPYFEGTLDTSTSLAPFQLPASQAIPQQDVFFIPLLHVPSCSAQNTQARDWCYYLATVPTPPATLSSQTAGCIFFFPQKSNATQKTSMCCMFTSDHLDTLGGATLLRIVDHEASKGVPKTFLRSCGQ